jgi:hypothetical protein
MGQSASRGLSKATEKVSKTALEQRPPIPSRLAPQKETTTASGAPEGTHAANPGSFLRGSGIATQDVRDVGQEMYLQHMHNISERQRQQQEKYAGDSASTLSPRPPPGNADMPQDLLRFIQDVGPAKQTIDTEFTTKRLLQEENKSELEKLESARKPRRARMRMPLMGDDSNFTTEKNTYFHGTDVLLDEDGHTNTTSASVNTDFGLHHIEFYDLLERKNAKNRIEIGQNVKDVEYDKIIDEFCTNRLNAERQQQQQKQQPIWTKEEMEQQRERLLQALRVLDLPVLRLDSDGHNLMGLYPKDVPGPEVRFLSPIPETKVMLVLKDLKENSGHNAQGIAAEKLMERRRDRKTKERH